jgi:hypothetical protein
VQKRHDLIHHPASSVFCVLLSWSLAGSAGWAGAAEPGETNLSAALIGFCEAVKLGRLAP